MFKDGRKDTNYHCGNAPEFPEVWEALTKQKGAQQSDSVQVQWGQLLVLQACFYSYTVRDQLEENLDHSSLKFSAGMAWRYK